MLTFRLAKLEDIRIYFDWANDPEVREQSFQSKEIDFSSHEKWFKSKLSDDSFKMLIFQNERNENIGQIRIQELDFKNAVIGISIDHLFRGKGYAKEMLTKACENYFLVKNNGIIHAYIKKINSNSKLAFEKSGFQYIEMIDFNGYESYHYNIKK